MTQSVPTKQPAIILYRNHIVSYLSACINKGSRYLNRSVQLFAVILKRIHMISRSYLYRHQVMWPSIHCTGHVIVHVNSILFMHTDVHIHMTNIFYSYRCGSVWLRYFLMIRMWGISSNFSHWISSKSARDQ